MIDAALHECAIAFLAREKTIAQVNMFVHVFRAVPFRLFSSMFASIGGEGEVTIKPCSQENTNIDATHFLEGIPTFGGNTIGGVPGLPTYAEE